MDSLLGGLLTNAVLVLPLALIAWTATLWLRRPALSHALWVLVLIKLITPPLISIAVVVDAAKWPTLAAALPVAESVPANNAPWPGITIYSRETIARMSTVQRRGGAEMATQDQTLVHPSPLFDLLAGPRTWAESMRYWHSPEGLRVLMLYACKLILGLVWVLGATVAAAVLHYRIGLLRRVLADAGSADRAASDRAALLYGRGGRRPPPVVLVEAVVSPTLVGMGKATRILFPAALWRSLPEVQRDTLLLHELAHFRRGDHWIRVLEAITSILFWWHPVVWFAKLQLRWDEELCCDAAAVSRSREHSRPYAEALLSTIDFISEADARFRLVLGTGVRPFRTMRCRLQRIMQRSVRSRMSRGARLAVLLVALVSLPTEPWLMGSEQANGFTTVAAGRTMKPASRFQIHLPARIGNYWSRMFAVTSE